MIGTAVPRRATIAPAWRVLAARLSSLALIGVLTGVVVGGLGGRLAMLVLRLTSDPSLHGLPTDDGFTIGVVSPSTLFLVMLTGLLGVVGALAYAMFRLWVPPNLRPWVAAVVAGIVGGAVVIRPGGIDFTRLEPLWLAVAMFIALPAAYGAIVASLVERSLGRPADVRWRWLVGLPLLVPVLLLPAAIDRWGLIGTVVAIAVALVLRVASRGRGLAATWVSPPVAWLGRTVLAAGTAFAASALVRDAVAVL